MNSRGTGNDGIIPRTLLGLSNVVVFASSAITTGIISYFLHWYPGYRTTHIVFNIVIAVLTLFFYLFAIILPILKSYRGYLLPLNVVLSYLWLTSLIFSSQDWAGNRCRFNAPLGVRHSHCGLKHTVMAFFIIGFSNLFLNTIIEAFMWASHRRHNNAVNDKTVLTPGPANGVGSTV